MNTKMNTRDIVLHKQSGTFGRIGRIDYHLNKLTYQTTPYRSIPKQMIVPIDECVYVGAEWAQVWFELGKHGLNDPRISGYISSPAPIKVTVGAYEACVTHINGFYRLDCTFLGKTEPLVNSFCGNHEMAISLGRALVLACRSDETTKYVGYNWNVGDTTNTGWVEFRGRTFPMLPNIVTKTSGHELGTALVQLGVMMKTRRELAAWLGQPVVDTKVG